MSTISPPASAATPVVITLSKSYLWLGGAALFGLILFYFIGVDQGAYSVFGNNTYVHEFAHDARHFLGFPCH